MKKYLTIFGTMVLGAAIMFGFTHLEAGDGWTTSDEDSFQKTTELDIDGYRKYVDKFLKEQETKPAVASDRRPEAFVCSGIASILWKGKKKPMGVFYCRSEELNCGVNMDGGISCVQAIEY